MNLVNFKQNVYRFLAKNSFTNKLHHDRYWGKLLKYLRKYKNETQKFIWEDLYRFALGRPEVFKHFLNGKIINSDFDQYVKAKYEDLIQFISQIENHEDYNILELGSGWGKNLIYLSETFKKNKFIAAELSISGRKITDFFSTKFNLQISSIQFNYKSHKRFIRKWSKNNSGPVIIITSFSIEQVPLLNKKFFLDLLNCHNKIIAYHIEPIAFQVQERDFPFKDFYTEHYNRNFYSILKELEDESLIKIIKIYVPAFGHSDNTTSKETIVIQWEKL